MNDSGQIDSLGNKSLRFTAWGAVIVGVVTGIASLPPVAEVIKTYSGFEVTQWAAPLLLVVLGILTALMIVVVKFVHADPIRKYKKTEKKLTSLQESLARFKSDINAVNRSAHETILQKMIELNDSVVIRKFSNTAEMERHLAASIRGAKDRIRDCSWKKTVSKDSHTTSRTESQTEYEQSIVAGADDVVYLEIFSFSHCSRLEKLKRRIRENSRGYSCRYIIENDDASGCTEIPRLQFVIIDDEEIIFASSEYKPHLFAIRYKPLVTIFEKYYEQAWNNAVPLIERDQIHWDQVGKVLGPNETESLRTDVESEHP